MGRENARLRAVREELLEEADINNVQNQTLIQEKRQQICDAALELFLEKGFAATTIRDICARSGVNQASIYDYIANKNDILRRLLNQLWFNADVPTLPEILLDDALSLEQALERYFADSWKFKRKGTLLAYRTIPHLPPEDRKAMRLREIAVMKDLADQLADRLGIEAGDQRLEIVANLMVFLSAFGPMRDWLNRDQPDEAIVKTIAAGAAAMIRSAVDDSRT
ncbi:TetR/AcrR family transcriptional regulator [Paracoccus saliphilus]|uniref:TetR/AcrR family transcriptional regulator n=1 Tax=Paracoccus saliphilus TaxID=405559 RepID=A0AA45W565_9RHOB|nr:TetR/AcrR family transcriptional regulator [Paracoccus saliphilus]WCR02183.1 TetR/AcrR family transcriptional regulator [Paracoccus saliphilus]SIS90982.1 transcriptional regulator, TetR family [Paracoccus saliphilus]